MAKKHEITAMLDSFEAAVAKKHKRSSRCVHHGWNHGGTHDISSFYDEQS